MTSVAVKSGMLYAQTQTLRPFCFNLDAGFGEAA
jgi:hypothetical protein